MREFVDVTFELSAEPPTSKTKREQKGRRSGAAGAAVQAIVEHILVLSFGERFAREMKDFARIYFEYEAAGWFD